MSGNVHSSGPLEIVGDIDGPSCDGGVCAVPAADTAETDGSSAT